MFTADNCEFSACDRRELNDALETLLASVERDDNGDWKQIEQSYSDRLNNEWFEGATSDDLVASVRG